jgi:hypothetical protein
MFGKSLAFCISLTFAASLSGAADTLPSAKLSAAAIVDRNVAARGGLNAWRAVQTMSLAGKLGAGGNRRQTVPVPDPGNPVPGRRVNRLPVTPRPDEEVQLPFLMELQRPRKMRFELKFNGQTAVQVYDGANGWKLRPFLNRGLVEPYTEDEMKTASTQADLDGPLVDYAVKGTRIELAGTEKVEGRDTYKIAMTMKSGQVLHVWIDAETFLETKIEGQPRRLDGRDHPVEVYFRDYRRIDGLQIPFILETKVLPVAVTATGLKDTPVPSERIIVEKVLVNPKLDASLFSKPQIEIASGR